MPCPALPCPAISCFVTCRHYGNLGLRFSVPNCVLNCEQMATTLSPELVLCPLNWSRGWPTDGDVMKSLAADGSRGLHAQPRQSSCKGVSFFVPSSAETGEVARAGLGQPVHGCAITVPGILLPPNLRFVHDRPLHIPVLDATTGQTVMADLGQHFTLLTSCATSTAAFEVAYEQI